MTNTIKITQEQISIITRIGEKYDRDLKVYINNICNMDYSKKKKRAKRKTNST